MIALESSANIGLGQDVVAFLNLEAYNHICRVKCCPLQDIGIHMDIFIFWEDGCIIKSGKEAIRERDLWTG